MDIATQKLSGKNWDTNLTLRQFDLILHRILLHVALADHRFDGYER